MKKRNFSSVLEYDVGEADVGIRQFSFVQTHGGKTEWELQADHAEVFEKDQKAYLKGVAVTIQTRDGWHLKLEGDEGAIDTLHKNFSLNKKTDLMMIDFGDDFIIETSGLKWFNETREIVTEGPARISGPQIEVEGTQVRVVVENQEMIVLGDVKALFY
ncbi:MAG: LPS export ABC transporter periplasmic protein LptC [Nitrospiria bacterium]